MVTSYILRNHIVAARMLRVKRACMLMSFEIRGLGCQNFEISLRRRGIVNGMCVHSGQKETLKN